jgi:hypothetical protein
MEVIPGMGTHFIYEEFYPNAKYDIEQAYDYFLTMLMDKKKDFTGSRYELLFINTKDYKNRYGDRVEEQMVIERISNFLESFDYFKIVSREIKEIAVNEDESDAQLTFEIHYEGCFDHGYETIPFIGNGLLKLAPGEYGGWDVYHIDMPGLEIG